jgi:hypothetical protein
MADVQTTLGERGKRYGTFMDNAETSQTLKYVMENHMNWKHLAPDQREALTVIAQKISRILSGDPNYSDNWHDIAGYAILGEDRLNGTPK